MGNFRREKCLKRLGKELVEVRREFNVETEGDHIQKWKVSVCVGPPYGIMVLDISFGDNYPFEPPKVLIHDVWHPNVYAGGLLCISILESENHEVAPGEDGQSAAERWTPALGVLPLLQGIISVIVEPNLTSPANVDANRDFMRDKASYDKKNLDLATKRSEKRKKIEEEKYRADREIRAEQERAFEQSLMADMRKDKSMAASDGTERGDAKGDESKDVDKQSFKSEAGSRSTSDHIEGETEYRKEPLNSSVLKEVGKSAVKVDDKPVRVRFRTPSSTFMLEFNGLDSLSVVYKSLQSRGFPPGTYSLSSFQSSKELTEFPDSTSLLELNMVPSITLSLSLHDFCDE